MAADDYNMISKHGKTTTASPVSPNSIKRPKERVPAKPDMPEVNTFIICQLCSGYLIDATAIIECQHTFCKSCILKYLETSTYCPVCDVQLNKGKPQLSLRFQEEPMNIHYRIFERPVKSVTVYSGMKRPAPSVMDEPPDDDTASGPHNRSSMFSSSSAPSSKLPRLADNTSASGNQGSVRNSNTSGKSTTTSTTASSTPAASAATGSGSLTTKPTGNVASNNSSSHSVVASSSTTSTLTIASTIKVEKEEVEEEEDNDDDDEDEEEDYELVERKEHMKGIKSSRRLHNSIKESMKRSVAIANSNHSLRTHQATLSSRSHSNDTKGINESERESARNENSLNSSSSSSSKHFSNKKRGKSHESQTGKGKPGKVDSLRLRVSSTSSSSSEHTSNSDGYDNHKQHYHQPLKLSISTSGVIPAVVSSSATVEKKEPLKLSLGSVLANKTGSKSPERKHHKHKHHHHHHHKLRHRDKQGKGVTPSATVTNNSQKPLKLSFTLSPPSVVSSQNSSGNQSQKPKASQESGEVKEKQNQQQQQQPPPPATSTSSSGKGKPLAGMQNYNNSARTSASAHGHLNNISKSISVSVNTNVNYNSGGNNSSTNTISAANSGNSAKGNQQYGNKMLSPAELIPKNTGIEIQPTTIPISSSQISQQHQQHSAMQSTSSSASGNNNSHKHSHPLLPDSVHVPKSVTLIPVNPNQMPGHNSGGANTGQMGKVNNAGMASSNSGTTSQEKVSSGSQGNRINAHTFTHPITNKSLHQITVTEVPPPQQKTSNAVVVTTTNTTHSSISVSTSNPIEKVIANAANNKPQFNGPGSMEITKIYCGTTSSSKENPAKKLKDRKGLDISITGTGFNVSVNKPTHNKLEEALRQKVNIAIGGGSGSISVTPAAAPTNNMSLLGQTMTGNSGNNNVNTGNKMKSVSSAAANLLSGKMPPGITIGPATMPPTSSSNSGNNSNSSNVSSGNSNITNSSAIAGNNIMKGLGFTLPPHLTAHPHNPNNMKISHTNSGNNSQAKSDKMNMPTNTMNNSRILGKDSISIIGKGNVTSSGGGQQQQPPPVEITISATGGPGGKSQASITNNRSGISIVNKSKMSNDHLASIFDITQGLQRKSPSPIINPNHPASTKDMKGMQKASQHQQQHHQQQQANKNANVANKRPFDVVSIGGVPQGNNNSTKKVTKESPEQKRSRSASTSSEPDKNKQGGNSSSSTGEIPLDLSGRSTRTTPPITIPHPKESSKSPSEKPRKSPERVEKPGIVISPSTPASNMKIPATPASSMLSSKMNATSQKNIAVPVAAATSEPFKGQSKSISVSKLSPNQSSKIGSIVDSLAQKQAQAQQQQQQQQQQLQSLKNSQNQHQQQKQQQSHHHHHNTSPNASTKMTSPTNIGSTQHSSSSGNNSGNTLKSNVGGNNSMSTKGSPSSSGLTSPITASPGIPMTSPSPPNSGGAGDHLRNLRTLSDSANRQGKLNQMNELLVAASLFSPPGHPHPLAGNAAAQQLAAAAASQQQQQQQQPTHNTNAGLKIPSVSSKQGSSPSGSSTVAPGKSPNSISFSPLFSHSVPVSSPKSPNLAPSSSSSISVKSPTTGSVLPFTSASSMPGSSITISSHSSNANKTIQHDQKHSHSLASVSGKSSHHHHHHHHHDTSSTHSSSHAAAASGTGIKSTKINGTVSCLPPGIHNPLLPSRSSLSSSNNSNNSGNSFQSGLLSAAAAKTALNKSFSALNKNLGSSSSTAVSNPTKGAIPNSMKISNFLPNKPKDSQSDANAEATITSGFGIMPPLQAKPNFSLSPSCSPPNNLIPPSISIPKNATHSFNTKESGSPISPVKGVAGTGSSNKPSSMTCASLLRPDSLFPKTHHPTHHLMNSLSPTKGDNHQQQHYALSSNTSRLSGRAPSSDSVLLSPSTNKTTSPGASTSNKSHNVSNKDGFRSTYMTHHHSGSKSLSPTKEIISSKKEIGSIPTGPAAMGLSGLSNRIFTTTASSSSSSPSSSTIARPIPTIPAFLNRSSQSATTGGNPCTQSLHNIPLSKDGLQQKSTSPVKMSNEQQRSHLPSPVFFPFPGVSVPVQVKLQDEDDTVLPAVTSSVTNTTSLSASLKSVASTTHGISLKPEVDKLLAAKEEKMEENRKRSCPADQAPNTASNMSPKSFSTSSETESSARKIKSDLTSPVEKETGNNACEIPAAPPAKVQKTEMHADASSSVKNEKTTALISENKCSSSSSSESSSNVCEKGAIVKSESELVAQRESKVGEGEKIEKASNEKKGDAVVVAGAADPSKAFLSTPANVACTTTTATSFAATKSPCKTVKAVEVSVEKVLDPASPLSPAIVASQSETQTSKEACKLDSSGNGGIVSVNITQEEKSTTQIALDTSIPRKSDETSIQIGLNRQESNNSVEIPKGTESGQLANNNASDEGNGMAEENNEEQDVEVDVEMDNEVDEKLVLGQRETANLAMQEMDTTVVTATTVSEAGEAEMSVDVDTNDEQKMDEEKKQSVFVEERVTLTKVVDDEDVDVDVVDVGVDEPMQINTTEMRAENDDAEELCIDVDNDTTTIIPSNQEDNERNAMEIVQNDEVNPENELIESQPENNNSNSSVQTTCLNDDDVNKVVDDGEDMGNNSEEKKDVEEEEEKESKDPVEISPDVIKRQRLEETDTVSLTEVASSPAQVEQAAAATSNETLETQESSEFQNESTFLAVNEASNFSQDDSECGDLVIDLGPNAGENEVVADDDDDNDHEVGAEDDENNEKEAEELLTQEESNHSAVVQLEIKESEEDSTEATETSNLEYPSVCTEEEDVNEKANEEEPALSIMNSEAIEANQGEEIHVEKSPAREEEQQQDEDIVTASEMMMMTKESAEPTTTQQVGHVLESLNQDSIPNQITIHPVPIEVNGVIKTVVDLEKSEESEKMPEDVAECPQVQADKNVHDLAAQSESSQDERGTLVEPGGNIGAPKEDNKNTCIAFSSSAEEQSTVCGVMVESNSQLEEASPVNDTTAEDNKNAADNNEASSAAVDDKKIEEEQQIEQEQCKEEEEQELSEVAMLLPDSHVSITNPVSFAEQNEETTAVIVEAVSAIGDDDKTAPVHFPEQDNNVESSENNSCTVDSSVVQQQCQNAYSLPVSQETVEKGMETPMEVEENAMNEETDDDCEAMVVDLQVEEEAPATETSALSVSEIDDDSMQMEIDCSVSQINDQLPIQTDAEITTTTPASVDEMSISGEIVSVNANSSEADEVAVISATITTASAPVSSEDSENLVLTPTTSTSSVAIKVDIAANDTDDCDDDAGKNVAASLLPSNVNNAATNSSSSSSLIIPSSNNSSGPSSSSFSSSSPVDVPTTTTNTTGLTSIGSKSLETFGKVAAGLLASATSTINNNNNNNNNNTSLAPTSCDAISIATTNANA